MSTTNNPTTDLDATFEQLEKLSPSDRVTLAERLIASVPLFPDKESEEALAKVVERRIQEIEDGTVTPVPADEVHLRIREKHAGPDGQ